MHDTSRRFYTATLSHHPRGEAVDRILTASIQAVEPGCAVSRFVQSRDGNLIVNGKVYHPEPPGSMRVIALGKAAYAMADQFSQLAAGMPFSGLLIPPSEFLDIFLRQLAVFHRIKHPLPLNCLGLGFFIKRHGKPWNRKAHLGRLGRHNLAGFQLNRTSP